MNASQDRDQRFAVLHRDIYAHVTDSLMRDAADRIDDAVSMALEKAKKVS
jgi:hypothetical protein